MKPFIKLNDGRGVMVRRRIRTAVLATATGVLLAAGFAVFAGTSQARVAPAPTGVLWSGDTARGTRVFVGLERAPGTIGVANDPLGQFGPSYRYETWQNPNGQKSRSESRGLRLPNGEEFTLNNSRQGQVFYLGWRALWDPMPTQRGAWISFFQLHLTGSGPGAGPFVLRTLGDGMLHFQLISPNGSSRHIWNAPLVVNRWHTFVIGFRLSRSASGTGAGWVSFWYDGVQQTFVGGSTQLPAATLMGSKVNVKWGVYRSSANHTGHAVEWINHARLASDYADAAP
jgi:polysaccharide lyase-like protein